jgi:hypothetical protein
MGILKQGILGGISGSVGNVTGSSWKGIAVIKAKPLSVANPKTSAQVAQRGKFSNAVAFAKEILSAVIKPLWDRFAQQKSGFNAFIQENIDLFASAMPSTPADLVISKGKMEKTVIASVVPSAGSNEVGITWADDSGEGMKLATDVPFAVVVNETTEEIVGYSGEGSVDREDLSVTVSLDSVSTGDVLRCYLAFRRADGTVVSNTDYDTQTVS